MEKVAKIVGQHEMKVFEVATFYTMFNREKRGKHFIQLCGTTPCMVCGSEEIKKTIMDELGIKNGGEKKRQHDKRSPQHQCSDGLGSEFVEFVHAVVSVFVPVSLAESTSQVFYPPPPLPAFLSRCETLALCALNNLYFWGLGFTCCVCDVSRFYSTPRYNC